MSELSTKSQIEPIIKPGKSKYINKIDQFFKIKKFIYPNQKLQIVDPFPCTNRKSKKSKPWNQITLFGPIFFQNQNLPCFLAAQPDLSSWKEPHFLRKRKMKYLGEFSKQNTTISHSHLLKVNYRWRQNFYPKRKQN